MAGESSRHNEQEGILQDLNLEPKSIPLEDLKRFTNNFSDERLLGEGGFGKVYKGVHQNGSMIAVKKFTSAMPGIHNRQFVNEAHHLMRLSHPNIVQLVGYCSERETILTEYNGKYVYAEKSEKLLCLEYLPKGSLRSHLSDESSGLGWDTHFKIIKGICTGLHYLHEECRVTPVIHMDLKPTNILLDDNMTPKIADFGLSRLFGEEQTRTCTKSHYGTLGYMAPEYLDKGIITKKLDIFSLGVIIIEIVTGYKDYPDEDTTSSQKFVGLVLKNWINRLENESGCRYRETECRQIERCIKIGLACVKFERAKRPTIGQIIKMLHEEVLGKCTHCGYNPDYCLGLKCDPADYSFVVTVDHAQPEISLPCHCLGWFNDVVGSLVHLRTIGGYYRNVSVKHSSSDKRTIVADGWLDFCESNAAEQGDEAVFNIDYQFCFVVRFLKRSEQRHTYLFSYTSAIWNDLFTAPITSSVSNQVMERCFMSGSFSVDSYTRTKIARCARMFDPANSCIFYATKLTESQLSSYFFEFDKDFTIYTPLNKRVLFHTGYKRCAILSNLFLAANGAAHLGEEWRVAVQDMKPVPGMLCLFAFFGPRYGTLHITVFFNTV